MNESLELHTWWDLHLRKARGELLSEKEQRVYDDEMARQDQQFPPLKVDLEALKKLRERVVFLAQENSQVRSRLTDVEREIRLVEEALSQEARSVLGVGK
jgi:hypothetical protein